MPPKEPPKNTGKYITILAALAPAIAGVLYILINRVSSSGSVVGMAAGIVTSLIGLGLIAISVLIFIIWGVSILVSKQDQAKSEHEKE